MNTITSKNNLLDDCRSFYYELAYHGSTRCDELIQIPASMDISSIKLLNADESIIEKVTLLIGGNNGIRLVFKGSDIHSLPLPEGGILFSKLLYLTKYLIIDYKDEYLESRKIYGDYEEEYIDQEEITEELVQIQGFDGNVHSGYKITNTVMPSGRTKRKQIGFNEIKVPDIEITLSEPKSISKTPYWESVPESAFSKEKLDSLKEQGKYKDGKIYNEIYYSGGLAGKMYSYG